MRKSSSGRWLREHFTDPYVKRAQKEGYRSRAVYKLLELQERDHLFKPGMTVIDLGAAPGGWSQLVAKLGGQVIALDILPMAPIPGVLQIEGDFSSDAVLAQLQATIAGRPIDWVISDIAPNMSGNSSIDMPRVMYLAELAFDFAIKTLSPEGGFLTKLFQGEGFDAYLKTLRAHFESVVIRKPKASRSRSREVYLLARKVKLRYD